MPKGHEITLEPQLVYRALNYICGSVALFIHVVSLINVRTKLGSEAHIVSVSLPPPPPRYPVSNNGLNSAAPPGTIALAPEAVNVLSHPTGPDYQLVVGEGTPARIRS